jgi:hypothetical protein
MNADIAQLEDMPNLFNLRIDGARECYGCSIECGSSTVPFPRMLHFDRQQEYLGVTSFSSVEAMSGVISSDLHAPYAAQNVFLGPRAREGHALPKTIDFMFMGNQNRDFAGRFVRRNISELFATQGATYNMTFVNASSNYPETMFRSRCVDMVVRGGCSEA